MTQEQALSLFEYRNGSLYCKADIGYRHKTGDKAGHLNGDGYIHINIFSKILKEHRIIFLMHHGYMPEFIDHKDRNRSNNKIDNLRDATYSQNMLNTTLQKSNSSGYRGVNKRFGKETWVARIATEKGRIYLGDFDTPEAAYEAYKQAALIHHKEFANV